MTTKQQTARVIQVSDDFDEFHVMVVGMNDEGDDDSHDSTHKTRAKAEARAAVLAKMCGCEWEANY